VRQVTFAASLFVQDLVDDSPAVILLLVAFEADGAAFAAQEMGRVGGVRIVTGAARPLLQRRMHSRHIQLQVLGRVTFATELVALLLEDEFAHDSVPKMATLALPVLDPWMHVAHREVFGGELLVTIEAFPLLEFPLLGVGRRRHAPEDDGAAQQGHSNARCVRLCTCRRHGFADSWPPSSGASISVRVP
jgi:hypothetical protein